MIVAVPRAAMLVSATTDHLLRIKCVSTYQRCRCIPTGHSRQSAMGMFHMGEAGESSTKKNR